MKLLGDDYTVPFGLIVHGVCELCHQTVESGEHVVRDETWYSNVLADAQAEVSTRHSRAQQQLGCTSREGSFPQTTIILKHLPPQAIK